MKITTKILLLAALVAVLVLAALGILYGSAATLQTKQQWLASIQSRWLVLNREILLGLDELDAAARQRQLVVGTATMTRFHAAIGDVAALAQETQLNGRDEEDEPEVVFSQELLGARTTLQDAARRLEHQWSRLEPAGGSGADAGAVLPLLHGEVRPAALALQQAAEKLIRHETSETEEESAAIRRQTLGLAAGVVALVGLMVLILYRDVARPLRRLAQMARAIRPGVSREPFHYHRRDELGDVATAFNQMLDTVEATAVSRNQLEEIVDARSLQLDLLSLVATHTTNLVVISDAQGRIESVNAGFERVTGYTLAEVRGRKPGTFLQGPGTDPATIARIRAGLDAGQPVSAELLNYAKNGRAYWLQIDIQPVRDPSGRVTHFIAIESEITERKRAAADLESYKNRLELALTAANTCTFDLDLAAKVAILDPRWSVMLGGPAVETRLPARELLRLLPPVECRAALDLLADCAQGRSDEYRMEYRVRDRQGGWLWIHSHGRVVERDASGRARRIIGTNTDVTARKSAELYNARQVGFLEALNQITLDVLERRSLPELLQVLVEHATVLIDAPFGELMLKEGDEFVVRAYTRNQPFLAGDRARRGEALLTWQAHDTRLPVVVDDYSQLPDRRTVYDACGPISAVAEIPILLGAECLGVIALSRNGTGRPFNDEEIQKALLLARLAALTVTNARIYEDALRAAETKAAALLESEKIYRHLVEHINQGFYTANARGLFTYCNPAISAVSGWSMDELQGTSSFRLVCPEDRPHVIAEYRRWARGTVNDVSVEFRTDTKSGRRLWVEQVTHILRNGDGEVEEFRCFLRDISDRKAAEAALRESEEHFRAVFDQSPISIALVTFPQGKIAAFNAAACATLGVDRNRVVGQTTAELNIWADPAERDRYLQLLKAQGKVTGFEARMRRSNGEIFPAIYNTSLIQIAGRSYSLNSIQDVTAWRRAEARFRDLFAFSPDAIIIGTQDGRIVDANVRAEQLFECSRDALIGHTPASLVPEEYRDALMDRLQHYLRHPVPHAMGTSPGALYARTVKGRVFPMDISLGPIRTDEGLLVVAAIRDVSRELEAAAQLRQAQKMESLGTLAGGIAHDFNNILTGIFGFVQLARLDLPEAHPASEWLDNLMASGNRAKELVQQILTFSRKQEGHIAPLRLQTVVIEALGLLRSTLPAMIELRQDIDPACPPVMADGTQVHQIVMNLCTNALHALPENKGLITVRLAAREVAAAETAHLPGLQPGPHAVLSVRDNGHGMSAGTLERIFEPFFTTKASGKGSGLGLAVVHGIVQSHAGAITVQSTVGHGTTFEIFLPVIRAPELPAGPAEVAVALPRGRNQRILFIDDELAAGDAVSRLIERLGYRVTVFNDPRRALERFQAAPADFDLVVTDLAMPDLPGNQLAGHLAQIRPGLPVILITGFLDTAREDHILAHGVRAILRKPPTIEELAHTLARCLTPRSSPGSST